MKQFKTYRGLDNNNDTIYNLEQWFRDVHPTETGQTIDEMVDEIMAARCCSSDRDYVVDKDIAYGWIALQMEGVE